MLELEYVKKEITAGMVLIPSNDADKAWNECAKRSIRIIDQYIKGRGLFQQSSINEGEEY